MLIPSRAWGFLRSGLNGRFGVLVADFGVGGTEDNPLLNDVDAGDEAAGVEFCPVFSAQEASGTLTVRTDGSLSFVGAADGTYVIPYALYTFTPGDSAAVDEGDTDVTVVVGAAAVGLVVADMTHAHTVDALTLTADAYLAVADTVHAHTIDNVVLAAEGVANLVVADATHDLTVDGLTLTSESLLAVQDALHSLGVDAVTLSVDAVLALQDALHAHTSDNLTLTLGGANLLVAESLHALTVDGVALTVDAYLVVLDARHVHTIDNVNLVIPGVVTGEANWVVFVAPESRLMLVPADFRAMLVPPEDVDLSV